MKKYIVLIICVLTFALNSPAKAKVTVDIYGPGQTAMRLIILPPRALGIEPLPAWIDDFVAHVRQNFSFLPFLEQVKLSTILGGDPSQGVLFQEINIQPLSMARVDLLASIGWNDGSLEIRVYETLNGHRLVGKAYAGLDATTVGQAADTFCSSFMLALTGKSGFFNSDIAFVKKMQGGREIFTVSPQGREVKQVTNVGGINLSPEWSKDGSKIIFTHIGSREHSLGILERARARVRLKSFPGYTVISPTYLPDGSIAATMSCKGSLDIWHVSKVYRVLQPLEQSSSIDVSPTFNQDGTLMAFASGRKGNPHIFVKDMQNGTVRRVTLQGKYNTNPCLSPNGRYIAFTRLMQTGHRIFVYDLETDTERQITFGPGSDEDPAFGPDGYFVAFASNRSGQYQLYMTTRHGTAPRHLPTGAGDATAPTWDTSRIQ